MSTGSSYTNQSAASRPIITPGARCEFQTYASAAYEPDANLSPPATSSLLANLALGERPLFSDVRSFFEPSKFREALLNVLLIGGAVGMIVIMATIVLVVPYWVFFAES